VVGRTVETRFRSSQGRLRVRSSLRALADELKPAFKLLSLRLELNDMWVHRHFLVSRFDVGLARLQHCRAGGLFGRGRAAGLEPVSRRVGGG
jgi:hypothetical protein